MDWRVSGSTALGRVVGFVRSHLLLVAMALCLLPSSLPGNLSEVLAAGTLRVGMTASDIPLTTGQPDQGSEGHRFVARNLYDGLVNWDMSRDDVPSVIEPGLAESWHVDENDPTRWIFTIRQGVAFHDGSLFTAHAAVWNFDKILDNTSEQYDPRQSGLGTSNIPSVKSYRALDDYTLEIVTHTPDATLPYQLTWTMMSSPANWEANDKDWLKVAQNPSGTGSWKADVFVPRERLELVPNPDYWNKKRIPKLDRMVLLPLPEANARTAALMSGQVDWVEAPVYDMVPALRANGFTIMSNVMPHNWTWQFSFLEDSPWLDIRVRKAANLAVDREGLVQLLGGLMVAAEGFLQPSSQWFGEPEFKLGYNIEEAKRLMAEAGYGSDNRLKVKTAISTSGSGQMLPLQMNELIQQNLAEIGIDVEFEVMDFNILLDVMRSGAKSDVSRGIHAVNYTYSLQDPYSATIRYLACDVVSPKGNNWGYYCNEELDEILNSIRLTFDEEEQAKITQKAHEWFVNEAAFLMVAHDVGPRAMSSKVKGFVQAQNWFQDFSSVTIEE